MSRPQLHMDPWFLKIVAHIPGGLPVDAERGVCLPPLGYPHRRKLGFLLRSPFKVSKHTRGTGASFPPGTHPLPLTVTGFCCYGAWAFQKKRASVTLAYLAESGWLTTPPLPHTRVNSGPLHWCPIGASYPLTMCNVVTTHQATLEERRTPWNACTYSSKAGGG